MAKPVEPEPEVDVYDSESLVDQFDGDEITASEDGFMVGYLGA